MQAILSLMDFGFDVWLEGDKIRYKQIRERIDQNMVESILAEIKRHKEEAIQYLQSLDQAEPKSAIQPCQVCGGVRWWISIYDQKICAICHPPASEKLVKEWIAGQDDKQEQIAALEQRIIAALSGRPLPISIDGVTSILDVVGYASTEARYALNPGYVSVPAKQRLKLLGIEI